jgi:branched-chain amino acid transport system permease protein
MTQFIEVTIAGLSLGAIYSLLAVGFVIIYRSTRVISFAQPAIMLFGAYLTLYLRQIIGMPFLLAVPLAMVLGALAASAIERFVMRPLAGKKEAIFASVMVTIGIDVILRVVTNNFIGAGVRPIGDPWGLDTFDLGSVRIFERDVAVIAASFLVIGALMLFIKRTRFGLAMRATADDQGSALAKGIPIGKMFNLSWQLAGALAAVAGAFVGAGSSGISQASWTIALKALPVIILGGLDSLGGALLGGMIIGLAEAMTAIYQPDIAPWLGSNFSLVVPYVVMVAVLLVKPYGLFGTEEVERV